MSHGLHLIGVIGTERVAMPAAQIEAVVRVPAIVPIPGAPPAIAGLVAVRSRVLTLLDCAALLAGTSPDAGQGGGERLMAVTTYDGHGYALLLDAVEDVTDVAALPAHGSRLSGAWAQCGGQLVQHGVKPVVQISAAAIIQFANALTMQVEAA